MKRLIHSINPLSRPHFESEPFAILDGCCRTSYLAGLKHAAKLYIVVPVDTESALCDKPSVPAG